MRKQLCSLWLLLISLSMLVSCNNGASNNSIDVPDKENVIINTQDNGSTILSGSSLNIQECPAENESEATDDNVKYICEKVKSIDFSVTQFPVDTTVYDSQTDRLYKEAFLNMLTNRTSLWRDSNGEEVYFRDFLRGERLDDKDFLQFILKRADYHYIDFEGDGLPELVIDTDGVRIFKYLPEEQRVCLLYGKHDKWHLLGSKQLYYYSSSSANRKIYAYEKVNEDSTVAEEVTFQICYQSEGLIEYVVSMGEVENVKVDESVWNDITKDYFDSIDKPLPKMTFDEIFGDLL